jgi:hypothetical protein
MAVERKISWNTYAIAFVISVLLFATGILVGTQLVQSVNQGLQDELRDLQQRTTEIELLTLLSDQQDAGRMCEIYRSSLADFGAQTADFDRKIDILEKSRGKNDPETLQLKKDYLLMQVRDYLLIGKMNSQCPQKTDTVLFFYTNKNCPECSRQGDVGPELKRDRPDVMIYAFDADLGLTVVDALEKINGVTSYPALVVNGQKVEGYADEQKIIAMLDQNKTA